MLQIIGSVVVVGCILGGFVAEGGHLLALWHPFEVLIIVGSATGAFLISNPMKVVSAARSRCPRVHATSARTT
jgi:chemotaxis protein MotA